MAKEEKKTLEERQKELQNELNSKLVEINRIEGAIILLNQLIEDKK